MELGSELPLRARGPLAADEVGLPLRVGCGGPTFLECSNRTAVLTISKGRALRIPLINFKLRRHGGTHPARLGIAFKD